MANSKINLIYSAFKRRFPDATVDQFTNYLRRTYPDLVNQFKVLQRQAEQTVNKGIQAAGVAKEKAAQELRDASLKELEKIADRQKEINNLFNRGKDIGTTVRENVQRNAKAFKNAGTKYIQKAQDASNDIVNSFKSSKPKITPPQGANKFLGEFQQFINNNKGKYVDVKEAVNDFFKGNGAKYTDKIQIGKLKEFANKSLSKASFPEGTFTNIMRRTADAIKYNPKAALGTAARGAAGIAGAAIAPVLGARDMVRNWNKEGSDFGTRLLDFTGALGAASAGGLGAYAGGMPAYLAGTLGGAGLLAYNQNAAQNRRNLNLAGTGMLKPLSDTDKQALELYKETGIGGWGSVLGGADNANTGYIPSEGSGITQRDIFPSDFEANPVITDTVDIPSEAVNGSMGIPSTLPSTAPTPINEGSTQSVPTQSQSAQPPIVGGGDIPNFLNPNNFGGNIPMPSQNNNNIPENENFIQNVVNRANNMTVDEARAGVQNQQSATGGAAPISDQDFEAQLREQVLNPQNAISPTDMRDLLTQQYAAMQQTVNQNPYYGGEYIQPQGYNVDQNTIRTLNLIDSADRLSGLPSRELSKNYADQQRQLYNAQIANQAGVPYEDYITGMTQRNIQNIALQQKQAEQMLSAYAQQATNMKDKLGYLQEMAKLRQQANQAIQLEQIKGWNALQNTNLKGQYDYAQNKYIADQRLKGDIYAADAGLQRQVYASDTDLLRQQQSDVAAFQREQLRQQNENGWVKGFASVINSLGLDMNPNAPQILANLFNALTPEQQTQIFGKPINPQDVNDMFLVQQTVQNNPSWFQQLINKYVK